MKLVILSACIPVRVGACRALFKELAELMPHKLTVVMYLDGFADQSKLPEDLMAQADHVKVNNEFEGAGGRWLFVETLLASKAVHPDDIVINIDDDQTFIEAPNAISKIVAKVIATKAPCAASGIDVAGKPAPPLDFERGVLIYAGGALIACLARQLQGLRDFVFDKLGEHRAELFGRFGDDDAVISAFFWSQGLKIHHAACGNTHSRLGSQNWSQSKEKKKRNISFTNSKLLLKRLTGWPYKNHQLIG